MSQKPKPPTREQVVAKLSQIIGISLTAALRAADMREFQFGTSGVFVLHVQCAWRIEGPDGIVTGRSDLWQPVDGFPAQRRKSQMR